MEQILQSTYLNDPDKWQTKANRLGGLEICDDDTGEPMYILEPHKTLRDSKKKLDLTPGSIIEDESGIWPIHINDDSKAVSCIKSFSDTWLTSEIAVNHVDDKELMGWFDADAHNLKKRKAGD